MIRTHKTQTGFTLIEMIVSLAVFSIVVTVAVGALLALVGTNEQLQDEQSVMTNLSFALDSMTRELRTGTNYYCLTRNSANNTIFDDGVDLDVELSLASTLACPDGRDPVDTHNYQGVAFIEGGHSITGSGGDRILYYYDKSEEKLFRRVGNGPSLSIVSSGIKITDAEFYVSSTDTYLDDSDEYQASITIFLEAAEATDADKKYRIQTSITQRTLDI